MRRSIPLAIAGAVLCVSAFSQSQPSSQNSSAGQANIQRANDLKIVDGPRVEATTDQMVVVAWSTDVESSAIVRFGTDQAKLDQTAMQSWGGQKTSQSAVHRVVIKGLKPETTYFFEVESAQGWNKSPVPVKSEVHSFTTRSAPESAQSQQPKSLAPLIQPGNIVAGPLAMNVTQNSAVIWWLSAGAMTGNIVYSKTQLSKNFKQPFKSADEKAVLLKGLEPNATYYYEVRDAGNHSVYEGSFKTENEQFPTAQFKIVKGPTIEVVGKETATISWSTSARSSSVVHYGVDPSNLDQTAMAPWGQELHRVVLRKLKPDTRYYFQVESAQAQGSGLSAKSNVGPFRTVAEGQTAMRNPKWR
jgi:phosphodiesterase/alkaline phosphatase D-like protein